MLRLKYLLIFRNIPSTMATAPKSMVAIWTKGSKADWIASYKQRTSVPPVRRRHRKIFWIGFSTRTSVWVISRIRPGVKPSISFRVSIIWFITGPTSDVVRSNEASSIQGSHCFKLLKIFKSARRSTRKIHMIFTWDLCNIIHYFVLWKFRW